MEQLQNILARLAPLQGKVKLVFVVVVELDDAVRVAAESQVLAAPLLFRKHHGLEQRTERKGQLPKVNFEVEQKVAAAS